MALTNAQYDEIMRGYEQRQTENRHRLELRTKEIYEKEPRLTLLDDEISSTSVSSARLLLSGDEAESQKLRERLTLLQKEKSGLIASLGYPKDYLAPTYTCADCKDTGYIGNERCHCFKQAAIDLVYTQSNLKSVLEKENFSTFSFSYYSDEQTNPATGLPQERLHRMPLRNAGILLPALRKSFLISFCMVIPVSARLFYLIVLQKNY